MRSAVGTLTGYGERFAVRSLRVVGGSVARLPSSPGSSHESGAKLSRTLGLSGGSGARLSISLGWSGWSGAMLSRTRGL